VRPPSTLSPALATDPSGDLRTVFGTMGGDGQPQVVLQMAARLLQARQDPGASLTAPRFTLTAEGAGGFDTWQNRDQLIVALEEGSGWVEGLVRRGHRVREDRWGVGLFGHANMIDVADGHLAGCADPRALTGAAAGY
jgi:gamma-glutamyltranspeptidase / glutathione hydrolase